MSASMSESGDPEWFGGGYLESVNDWWEDIPDVHGDIRIYTRDADEFVDFRSGSRMDGRIEEIDRTTS